MKSLSSLVMPPCDSSRLQCDNWSHLERLNEAKGEMAALSGLCTTSVQGVG